MKNRLPLPHLFTMLIWGVLLIGFLQVQGQSQKAPKEFSFAFLTDIHLQPEQGAVEGFRQAMNHVMAQKPDFVITGGDLIMDALGVRYSRADSLYRLYSEETKRLQVPVYNTLGNHEVFGIYPESKVRSKHPEFGEKMFEGRLGKSYYSFSHKGWKFIVLNSVEAQWLKGYVGLVDRDQMAWLKKELESISPDTPIVLSTHIPLLLPEKDERIKGATLDSGLVVANGREVFNLFSKHKLKLVLQGHLHTVEEYNIDETRFVIGGAVSAGWWKGPYLGFEEGYVLISVKNQDLEWKYMDYGWEAKKP